jgi:AP endonuclease 1
VNTCVALRRFESEVTNKLASLSRLTMNSVRISVRKAALSGQNGDQVTISSAKKRKLSMSPPSTSSTLDLCTLNSSSPSTNKELPVASELDVNAEKTVSEELEARIKSKRKRTKRGTYDPADFQRQTNEWKFGAHVSAAGGVENAIINAAKIG